MATTGFPFTDFTKMDFTKMMSDVNISGFKIPTFNVEALAATQKKNLEAFTSASQMAVEAAQEIAKRQSEIMTKSFEEMTSVAKDVSTPGNIEDQTVKSAEILKTAYQTNLSDIWDLGELSSKSVTKSFGVINKRVAESLDEVKGYFKAPAKAKAPTTSASAK